MKMATTSYKPALRWNGLTGLYDAMMAVTMREKHFRAMLLEPIRDSLPRCVLDIGCGTGSQTVQLKRLFPKANVIGLDGDQTALTIARQKARRADVFIEYEHGLATELPHSDQSIDILTCSLLLHHLSDTDKVRVIQEMRRVLSTNGVLMLADWDKPANELMQILFYGLQLFDGFDTTRANGMGLIPNMLYDNGFKQILQIGQVNTLFGTLAIYQVNR